MSGPPGPPAWASSHDMTVTPHAYASLAAVTLAVAQLAVRRDAGIKAPGLALAYSADMREYVR